MKHLGMFERDNRKRGPSLAVQVNLVGSRRTRATRLCTTGWR